MSRLLVLTQVALPEVNGGKPTKCYAMPEAITLISRALVHMPNHSKMVGHRYRNDSTERMAERHHPPVEATALIVAGNMLWVTETPEEIFELMDPDAPIGFTQRRT